MKVKIINADYADKIEKEINKFIAEIEKDHMKVVDIKYVKTDAGYSYSALVMYKPDGILRLDAPWLM